MNPLSVALLALCLRSPFGRRAAFGIATAGAGSPISESGTNLAAGDLNRLRFMMILAVTVGCGFASGCKSAVDDVSIKDVYGPAGRHAKNIVDQAKVEASDVPPAGLDEFNAARKLYEEQKYAEARKALHQIVKKYKKKKEPIVEDALFYRAECDFQLQNLADAQDGYDELMKEYPSTKYLEQSVRRLFAIARYWLNMPKPASEIELTSFEEELGEERLKDVPDATIPWQFPLTPNFTDKSRPMFDTAGRARQALNSISIHDIEGPLADDALMMLATWHLRRKDYREADHFFSMIRSHHQKSEYAEAAYVLGAHASLMSYQGADYDSHQLDEAKKLAQQAVRLYPASKQRPKLEHDLKKIEAEGAERAWKRVEYHLKRNEKISVAVYGETIMEKYPESPRAAEARALLLKLGPQYQAGLLTTPLFKKDPGQSSEREAEYDEHEEPARLHVSDEDGQPISDAK